MLGKTEGKRRRRWQRTRWLDSITDSVDMNLSKFQEDRGAWCSAVPALQRVGRDSATDQQQPPSVVDGRCSK